MSFKGMDPDQLREFAVRLNSAADAVSGAHSRLGAHLHQVDWHGALAERFRDDWFGSYQSHVGSVVQQLRLLASQVAVETKEQEGASGIANQSRNSGAVNLFHSPRKPEGLALAGGVFFTGSAGGLLAGLRNVKPLADKSNAKVATTVGRSAGWTADWGASGGSSSVRGIPVQGQVQGTAFALAHAGATATVSKNGLDVATAVGVAVGFGVSAQGSVGTRNLGASGGLGARADANANARAGAHIGKDGVVVTGKVSAEAVVSADAHATVHAGGVEGTATAHAYAGVGGHASAEAKITAADVKVTIRAGAALGFGAGVDYAIDVHPIEVWHNMTKITHVHVSYPKWAF